jgi:carbamate kinase
MLMVVAVGGNAQLERGDGPLADTKKQYAAAAVEALAPMTREHESR